MNSSILLIVDIIFLFWLESWLASLPQDRIEDSTRSAYPTIPPSIFQGEVEVREEQGRKHTKQLKVVP